jgi:plastocyanin
MTSSQEDVMRRVFVAACGALCALSISASCGGGGGGNGGGGNPVGPNNPPASNVATIQIVGSVGAQAFNPNPAAMTSSRNVVWNNSDDEVHRIVANDGSFDTGNLAPGATSAAIPVSASGARYHCSLHVTMVGAVNDTGGATPPCSGLYC